MLLAAQGIASTIRGRVIWGKRGGGAAADVEGKGSVAAADNKGGSWGQKREKKKNYRDF